MAMEHGSPNYDVIVVGAGLSGLACANALHKAGKNILVVEAADSPGGRVRSFRAGEYVCDRGFQVLLDAYPEAQEQLDYDVLQLGAFKPGAVLMFPQADQADQGALARRQVVADPLRVPSAMFSSLAGPGSIMDKLRILRMSRQLRKQSIDDAMADGDDELSTRQFLAQSGFSEELIEGFFSAWFGGILSDRSLSASVKLFKSYYGALVRGSAVLPAGGMQAIPDQLAASLPESCLRYESPVASLQLTDDHVEVVFNHPTTSALLRWSWQRRSNKPLRCWAKMSPRLARLSAAFGLPCPMKSRRISAHGLPWMAVARAR